MNELKTTTNIVKTVLENDEAARSSDSFLYLRVIEYIGEKRGFNPAFMTVRQLLTGRKYYGIPAFETVRRTRQKLQQTFPELAAVKVVEEGRAEREKAFRGYARGRV